MENQFIFNFKTDVSSLNIPEKLNNPFGLETPEIARIAAQEFQQFIASESHRWIYNFRTQNGKMFGILVVQKEDSTYGYLGTASGKVASNIIGSKFIPSVFDVSIDDFFINKGMNELTEIGNKIKSAESQSEIIFLKETRKQKSLALQRQLFERYRFINLFGQEKNVSQIFQSSSHGNPPSAAGECTAPKLLNHALKHRLKPIALAEFWWGKPPKNKEREHKVFYPACKNKCRPILEYMLDDAELFNVASAGFEKESNTVKRHIISAAISDKY